MPAAWCGAARSRPWNAAGSHGRSGPAPRPPTARSLPRKSLEQPSEFREQPMSLMHTDNAGLVAQLNDLLQLDYDAIAAYRVTLAELDAPALRAELQRNLDDHERHITELGEHIDQLGGMKMSMPHITGAFKLAVQAAVAMGSDRSVLLAFKANELQSRDKYARAAEHDFPQHIAMTVRRAAADERRHYDWAVRALVG